MSDDLPAHLRPARSFQGLILALQRYWADYGCVILQPYDMEVGAGTFHPATTLRALGPKPWNAAYVQPSRRPKDGRYGENPNARRLGARLGVLVRRHGGLAIHVFSAGRGLRMRAGLGRIDLRPRAARDVRAGRRQLLRPQLQRP